MLTRARNLVGALGLAAAVLLAPPVTTSVAAAQQHTSSLINVVVDDVLSEPRWAISVADAGSGTGKVDGAALVLGFATAACARMSYPCQLPDTLASGSPAWALTGRTQQLRLTSSSAAG